jgi:phosphoribosyl 1,2-cyclic phosphodiesterase
VDYPVELARRAGAARVLLFHHDPSRTDNEVAEIERRFDDSPDVVVLAAREGATFHLGSVSPPS